MTDKKRTERTEKHTRALDNEIKKALELGKNVAIGYTSKGLIYVSDALDLINRLQAEKQDLEIELKAMRGAANSYKAENEELKSAINGFRGYDNKIKAEAYKEFAEFIFSLFPADKNNTTISRFTVRQKLKELVGDA